MSRFDKFHLSSNVMIKPGGIPGDKSKKLLDLQKEIEGNVVSYPKGLPCAFKRAKGAIVEDVDGNQLIDFFSGCGVLNVGHCNAEVLASVREQEENLIHALDFPTENKLVFISKLLENLPTNWQKKFKVSFGGPTGSDAVEAAIKLAKQKTGRETIIAFQGSYHGMTSGALAVTSNISKRNTGSLVPNVHFIPYSYCYRCPFNKDQTNCNLDCANYLEMLLNNPNGGVNKPAAIILEPIQGEGGTIVPKEGFLKNILTIAKANDVIVIFDEIQSGFFRTGHYLSYLDDELMPDIITLSKGIGGVGFPLSAVLYKKEVEAWESGDHIGTFRANQVSIAAGSSAFDFIQKYNVPENVKKLGEYLMEKLKTLEKELPVIGEVRGVGLFIGIEYVKNKSSKIPYPEFVNELKKRCFENGLMFEVGGHFDNVVRFIPTLIITKEIVDNAFRIFEKQNHLLCQKLHERTYETIS